MINEAVTKEVGVREIKNIQHQLNYSNKMLSTLSKVVDRMENPSIKHKINENIPKVDAMFPILQPNEFKLEKLEIRILSKSLKKSTDASKSLVSTLDKFFKSIDDVIKDIRDTSITSSKEVIMPLNRTYQYEMNNHYFKPSPLNLGYDDIKLDKMIFDGSVAIA